MRDIKNGANDVWAFNHRTVDNLKKQKCVSSGGVDAGIPQIYLTKLGELVLAYVETEEYKNGVKGTERR